MPSPEQITGMMMADDRFSQWLGIQVLESREGYTRLRMTIREDMLNGFGIAHGGITFSLADSALAFASNSHGQKSVSVETSISHTRPLKLGEAIVATASEEHRSGKIAIYTVRVTSGDVLVALFKGTVYRTSETWA